VTLISLNTESCYVFNLKLAQQEEDSGGQLAWLESTLEDCHVNERVAFIIAHIAPGYMECNRQWSLRFNALLERYQHVVRLMTFGHDHRDLFQVMKSLSTGNPINVAHMAGQLSSKKQQPSFRVYTMDTEYNVPVKIETYYLDLEEINTNDNLEFTPSKIYPDSFGMSDLRPSNWLALAERFKTDPAFALEFHL